MALYDFEGIAKAIATARGPVLIDQADQPDEGDTLVLKPNGKFGYTPAGSGGTGGGGDDGDESGLIRDPVIKTANFTALINHSYDVSTSAGATDGDGEEGGDGPTPASDIAITLPADPNDGDQVELHGVNDGDARFIINENGHAIVYPTGISEDGVSWVFEGKCLHLLLDFRSTSAGGDNRWHTIEHTAVVLFGSNGAPYADHIIKTDQDGRLKVVHRSYFMLSYGIGPTVTNGTYEAHPFEVIPVDLSSSNVTISLPHAPFGGSRILVKIKTAGPGNTCTVAAPDIGGDSIDWLYPTQTLSAEGDWIEVLYNDVEGTWLVIG